jgi:hypothetical protein
MTQDVENRADSAVKAGRAGAPENEDDSPNSALALKLRIERIKCLDNARTDFAKRLYDPRPIGKQYLAGNIELHLHFLAGDRMLCSRYRSTGKIEKSEPTGVGEDAAFKFSEMQCQFTMFIGIADVPKGCRPIDTSVRLQTLDHTWVELMPLSRFSAHHAKRFRLSSIGNCVPSTIFPESSLAVS